jgi:sulfate/thiosulfate transport system substrate-binding protein
MLFLVRNGNPKGIKDWDDLIKPGVQVIVVNPKTGGNGRMAYLAAWGYVRKPRAAPMRTPPTSCSKLYKNVPVLARGGRDATGIFLQRNIGDVLVTFESEVVSVDNEFGKGKVDAIHPSASIVAENPVASWSAPWPRRARPPMPRPTWTSCIPKKGRRSPPSTPSARATKPCSSEARNTFKPLKLFTVEEYFGSL